MQIKPKARHVRGHGLHNLLPHNAFRGDGIQWDLVLGLSRINLSVPGNFSLAESRFRH